MLYVDKTCVASVSCEYRASGLLLSVCASRDIKLLSPLTPSQLPHGVIEVDIV